MQTKELIEQAENGLNNLQNQSWRGNYDANVYDPSQNHFVQACFADIQARALLAIAQEFKRMNDNKYGQHHGEYNE
jgi:hypothetical protein